MDDPAKTYFYFGAFMNSVGLSVVSGFAWGIGMILAAALMKVVLHLGFCG